MKISKQSKRKETTFIDTSNYLSSNIKYSIQINNPDEVIDIEFKDMNEVRDLYELLRQIICHDIINIDMTNDPIHDITVHEFDELRDISDIANDCSLLDR